MPAVTVPPYHEFLVPALRAVSDLGGSSSISEMVDSVVGEGHFSDEQQALLHNDGPQTEIGYRLAWARTYLKGMGLLTNSQRGVWALTDKGSDLLTDPNLSDADLDGIVQGLRAEYIERLRATRKNREQRETKEPDIRDYVTDELYNEAASDEPQQQPPRTWKETLLEAVMLMQPGAFERLAKRLLREADFASVNVTGKSGDGGIDGMGVYRLGLVSFPVFFQCKRYRGSVGSGAVRDFRGAMAGRGDKGLLITTGTFTAEAQREAVRDGAPAIDLIDGERLCDLLKRYELGVQTKIRQEEDVSIEAAFFDDL